MHSGELEMKALTAAFVFLLCVRMKVLKLLGVDKGGEDEAGSSTATRRTGNTLTEPGPGPEPSIVLCSMCSSSFLVVVLYLLTLFLKLLCR